MQPPLSHAAAELSAIIRQSRRRLRWLSFLHTLSAVLLVALVVLAVTLLALDWVRYDPLRVTTIRWLSYTVLALLLVLLAVLPWLRRLPVKRLALYLEERSPELRQVLLSAVECLPVTRQDPADRLQTALIEQALQRCRQSDLGIPAERKRMALAASGVTALLLLGVGLYLWQPGVLVNGLPYLLPWRQAQTHNPYQLAVQPGNQRILQGADQLIEGQPLGFAPDQAVLWTRPLPAAPDGISADVAVPEITVPASPAEAGWQSQPMAQAADGLGFEVFLFDQQQSLAYFVAAEQVRSPVYQLEVLEPPSIQHIELTYHYPADTGLAAKTVLDEGDISVLPGTRVAIRVQVSQPAHNTHPLAGQLVLNGQQRQALQTAADGWLDGELTINAPGIYRIDLALDSERYWPSTPDYRIEVREDRAPLIRFTAPGRDIQVTNLEEPMLALTASDDFALDRLELKLMINGGEEQTVPLHTGGELAEVSGEHVVMLEDLALQPGDLVAYYGRAVDRGMYGDGQETATDMYFLQIRAFEREYRTAEQQGGGGGGGEDEGALSAQQRQFVVAIFKLQRDQKTLPEATAAERRDTLAQVQTRIRERVEAIIRRLGERGAVQQHEGYRQMLEELPKAVTAMKQAERTLSAVGPTPTLPPAQKALQHLQRAEAAFRETQVAQGGQGGSGSSQAEDLTALFQLELDKLRNQYESVQRGQAQEQQEMDELLRKLRELARRQEQELERQQRRLAQSNPADNSSSGGSSGSSGNQSAAQQALAEAAEELARQLARLSRKRPEDNTRPEPSQSAESQQSDSSRQSRQAQANSANSGQSSPSAAASNRPMPPTQSGQSGQSGRNTPGQTAQNQSRPGGMDSAQQRLQQAIQQMQQAAATAGAEGIEARRQALQALQRTLQELSGQDRAASSLAQDLDNAQRRTERLAAWQQQGLETLREWTERQAQAASAENVPGAAGERPDTAALRQRKQQMALESEALEQSLRRMIRPSEEEHPQLSQQLREIVTGLDQKRLSDRLRQMDRLLQWRDLQQAERLENYIASVIDELGAELSEAQALLQQESGPGLEQALAQVQSLMQEVAEAQQQGSGSVPAEGQGNPDSGQNQQQGNQSGEQQASQQNGQPGEQQSQQAGNQPGGQQAGGQTGSQPGRGSQQAGESSGQRIAQGNGNVDGESRTLPAEGRFGPPGARQRDSAATGQWSETAAQLAESLRARGIAMDRINAVLSGVREYEQQANAGGQSLQQYQAALLDDLRQLEFALRQQVQPERPQARLPISPVPVAPEYRAEVEQYFRELAADRAGISDVQAD